MLAKPVVKNKFWIVENSAGDKVATIQKVSNGTKKVVLVTDEKRTTFPSIKVLGEKHNIKIGRATSSLEQAPDDTVYGYPVDVEPFNVMYNVQKGLPLYTKLEASKSFFCAGYYLINYSGSWVKSFCPKLLTLDRNRYKGPFKTEEVMKTALEGIRK